MEEVPPEASTPAPPAPAPPQVSRGALVTGLVALGGVLAIAAVLGLASALGFDLSIGDSDNRGMGKPLSREESAALLRGERAAAETKEECAVEVGKPLSQRCKELQEEERERRMDFVPDQSALDVDTIEVDKDSIEMLRAMGMANLPGVTVASGNNNRYGGRK